MVPSCTNWSGMIAIPGHRDLQHTLHPFEGSDQKRTLQHDVGHEKASGTWQSGCQLVQYAHRLIGQVLQERQGRCCHEDEEDVDDEKDEVSRFRHDCDQHREWIAEGNVCEGTDFFRREYSIQLRALSP